MITANLFLHDSDLETGDLIITARVRLLDSADPTSAYVAVEAGEVTIFPDPAALDRLIKELVTAREELSMPDAVIARPWLRKLVSTQFQIDSPTRLLEAGGEA